LKVIELGGKVLTLSDSTGSLVATSEEGFSPEDISTIADIKLARKSLTVSAELDDLQGGVLGDVTRTRDQDSLADPVGVVEVLEHLGDIVDETETGGLGSDEGSTPRSTLSSEDTGKLVFHARALPTHWRQHRCPGWRHWNWRTRDRLHVRSVQEAPKRVCRYPHWKGWILGWILHPTRGHRLQFQCLQRDIGVVANVSGELLHESVALGGG
jgi:hypothetical protein